jgi:hypothetical protein
MTLYHEMLSLQFSQRDRDKQVSAAAYVAAAKCTRCRAEEGAKLVQKILAKLFGGKKENLF